MTMLAFTAADIRLTHGAARGLSLTRMIDVWRSRRA